MVKRFFPLIFLIFLFVFYSRPALAQLSKSYDGCFERSSDVNAVVIWLKAPICTITLSNPSALEVFSINFTVHNLDPEIYDVRDENGNLITTTSSDGSLFFTANVDSATEKQITLIPWDYDENNGDFWFAAISDPQSQPDGDSPNTIFVDIMDQIEMIRPNFVTISGDIIGGAENENEEHEAEYELYDEILRDFEGSSFLIPGDHDAEVDLDEVYSSFFGSRNFTFTYANMRIVGFSTVDDSIEGKITDEILSWLSETLRENTADHLVILMHHPLKPPSWANSIGVYESQRHELAQLFVETGVDLIITGDVHGYDYDFIDSSDFAGLSAGFYQLSAGGAGGKITNYDGDYFFVLLNVTEEGITPYRMDYSTVDISTDFNSKNNGKESTVSFNVINNSSVPVPFSRVKVKMHGSEKIYASDASGNFLHLFSQATNSYRRAIVEIGSISAYSSFTVNVKERSKILTGAMNNVGIDGLITFDSLPTIQNLETNLTVLPQNESQITVDIWDEVSLHRLFEEITVANSTTTFNIADLLPSRQYDIIVNDKYRQRVATDKDGLLNFSFNGKKSGRSYEIRPAPPLPKLFGILPSSNGGGNLRLYDENATLRTSFFVYNQNITGGFSSVWADIDGDGRLEIIVAPQQGINESVRAYSQNGGFLAGVWPFGNEFSGGYVLTTADLNNDGKEEVIVGAANQKKSVIRVYSFNDENGNFDILDSWRVFRSSYRQGVELATGDLNDDGYEELIVGASLDLGRLKIYEWDQEKSEIKLLLTKMPFGKSSRQGLAMAAGDLDFDGKDEIVVGSKSQASKIKVFSYQFKKRSLKLTASRRIFGTDQRAGFNFTLGDVNGDFKQEIFILPNASWEISSRVFLYSLSNENVLKKISSFKPFGADWFSGLTLVTADVDGDWQSEIIVAPDSNSGKTRVYEWEGSDLKRTDSYYPYSSDFTGGLQFVR